ncbi:hypothetical protein FM104_07910 [Microbacterium esteraromaticum]|uniref:NAD(P)-binding domain-containing protein n=1 Tax=Microbacterium esteraromaticum TaxID=57043 RepID=A0A1R4JKX7_9MICO|nr:NAD(P)H-binding protein [Microbacterium esteraromaticum]SJN32455.1 hypothetical protein FM104_07910 [Microbacterium esteraromaticum]
MDIAIAGGTGVIGTHVAEVVRARGHAVRLLTRSECIDVRTGVGLEGALRGADAVIDVLNPHGPDAKKPEEFFRRTTANLLEAEGLASVRHHVALSIVGVDRAPHGYYAAKLAQEQVITASDVPWTIQRATQFHDFAAQMYARARIGPLRMAVRMRTQPVDAVEVATRLVELAEHPAHGRAIDLAGPREEDLAAMMRAWARHHHKNGWMPKIGLPGGFGRAMRSGDLLPGVHADLGQRTFEEWLVAQPD